jgi:hypothetical protein
LRRSGEVKDTHRKLKKPTPTLDPVEISASPKQPSLLDSSFQRLLFFAITEMRIHEGEPVTNQNLDLRNKYRKGEKNKGAAH